MSNILTNIKELISFYIKTNYEEYLKVNNIDKIEESKINEIVTKMFDEKKEHLQTFVKNALKDLLEKEEYPGDNQIDIIFSEIIEDRDFCITKLTTEIKLYQKNK
tara:strand:+ start:4236 stop:4550 length:315 start_codon:yes stop_codon:yes gene_type:complete